MTLFRGISDSTAEKCIHSDKNTPGATETWQRSLCQGGSAYKHKLLWISLSWIKALWPHPERGHLHSLLLSTCYRSLFHLRRTISHRIWQDLKEETTGKGTPVLVTNFLQASLGLGFLSQHDQESISIFECLHSKRVKRKRGNEQIEKTRKIEWFYISVILRLVFLVKRHPNERK